MFAIILCAMSAYIWGWKGFVTSVVGCASVHLYIKHVLDLPGVLS